jgi:hypothetical protein
MRRLDFVAGSCWCLLIRFGGVAEAQATLDLVPPLIRARSDAENLIKQVHLLAKYAPTDSSPPPMSLVAIDGQYDDLVAKVNGYLQALGAAILLPNPLDDKHWKSEGEAVVAQAAKLDESMVQLKALFASTSNRNRTPLLGTLASIIGQVLVPGSTLWGNTKKQIDQSSSDRRKQILDVLQTAQWRESATVLGLQPAYASPKPH